jgi:hypothetical protein
MQTGSVTRHGRGWREDGRRRSTATHPRKGDARAALNAEPDRLALGDRYRPPLTFDELRERFLAQYVAAPETVEYAKRRLKRRRAFRTSSSTRRTFPGISTSAR